MQQESREVFAQVLQDDKLFSLFVKFNLNDSIQNNRILFFETTETLLDIVLPKWADTSIDLFRSGLGRGREFNSVYFPEESVVHVHQICLTYLVGSSPFPLNLDPKVLHQVSKQAALSPIPITLFDELIQVVLEKLFNEQFPLFAKKYNLLAEDQVSMQSPPPSPVEEIQDWPDLKGPNTLHHATSSLFEYIQDTADSIYSDVDELSVSEHDMNEFRRKMKSKGRSTSIQSTSTQGTIVPKDRQKSTSISSSSTANAESRACDMLLDLYEPSSNIPIQYIVQTKGQPQPNWKKSIKESVKRIFHH